MPAASLTRKRRSRSGTLLFVCGGHISTQPLAAERY